MNITTTLASLYMSSNLPDIITIAADTDDATVTVKKGDDTIYSSTLFAYLGVISFYDIRSIIEAALWKDNETDGYFTLMVDDGTNTATSSFTVIMSALLVSDADTYIAENYLTTRTSYTIAHGQRQSLTWYAPDDEEILSQILAVVKDDETEAVTTETITTDNYTLDSINTITITPEAVEASISSGKTLIAFTVQRGARMMTFYVVDEPIEATILFQNSFNAPEYADLNCVTTHKQKVERQEAKINNSSVFYDQDVEHTYKVKTSALSMEEGEWLNQMFASHYAAILMDDDTFKQILITESDQDVSDSDDETIRAEFTYKLVTNRTKLPAAFERIFTQEYQPIFA